MPRDVAVQQPGARVIGSEGHGQETPGREERGVPTRRVGVVEEFGTRDDVPGSRGLGQDDEVAAVEVDWVSSVGCVRVKGQPGAFDLELGFGWGLID